MEANSGAAEKPPAGKLLTRTRADQVTPPSELWADSMKVSGPMAPWLSFDCQTAIALPWASMAMSGEVSSAVSDAALGLSGAGFVHVAPLSALRAKSISGSAIPSREPQTATQ